jgi:hypothetical protein
MIFWPKFMSETSLSNSASNKIRNAGWVLVSVFSAITLYSFHSQQIGLASDVATYTLAGAQFDKGKTENPHTLVSVEPTNISQLRQTLITWWPRSYGSIPRTVQEAATSCGVYLNIGQTMRLIVVVGWVSAMILWGLFFWQTTSATALPWLILLLMCARYSHANGYLFDGGEFLYWAVFPAVLLVNLAALRRHVVSNLVKGKIKTAVIALTVLAGFCSPTLIFFKYSAGLSAVGFAVAWMWLSYRKQINPAALFYWALGGGISTAVILNANWLPVGNPTQVDSPLQWTPLLWGLGAWLFAMTDLGTLVNKFTVDILPAMGNHQDGSEGWLFLPLVFLVLLIIRRENGTRTAKDINPLAKTVVITHLFIFTFILVGLMIRGSAIHLDTRFLRPAAIAMMPWIIPCLVSRSRTGVTSSIRLSAVALTVVLVIVPCLYGTLSLMDKTLRMETSGPQGLRHSLLESTDDVPGFFDELLTLSTDQDVIYITDPALGIPLVSRRLFTEEHAHLRSQAELSRREFHGRPQGRLLIPLPLGLQVDGRGETICNSFKDISHWTTHKLSSQPTWVLYIGSTE